MPVLSDLTEKERQIAAAALRVFVRYGLKRATMNDVAEEAGVVRQTLYNVFANKSEVIRGTTLFYCEVLRDAVRASWDGVDDPITKLDLFCEHYVLASWDAVHSTPDAGDLESGTSQAAKAALHIAEARVEEMLADAFAPNAEALIRNGQDPQRFVAFVSATLMGLKHGAADRDTLIGHLDALKSVVRVALK